MITSLEEFYEKLFSYRSELTYEDAVIHVRFLCQSTRDNAKNLYNAEIDADNLFSGLGALDSEGYYSIARLRDLVNVIGSEDAITFFYRVIYEAQHKISYDEISRMRLNQTNYFHATDLFYESYSIVRTYAELLVNGLHIEEQVPVASICQKHVAEANKYLDSHGVTSYSTLQSDLKRHFQAKFDNGSYQPGRSNFLHNIERPMIYAYTSYQIAKNLISWGYFAYDDLPEKAPKIIAQCPYGYDCSNCSCD